ncbi:MAG: hypothetical protein K8R58_09340 [Bacteroidales bacterium]|nr:hypothetical protein [Bacteroidales bacterium]
MKKKSIGVTVGGLILASAVIWGAVIVGCSFALKGTECYNEIQNILIGGVGAHLILIWGPMGVLFKKIKESKTEENIKE